MASRIDAALSRPYEHAEKTSLDTKQVEHVVNDGHSSNDSKEVNEGHLPLEQTVSYLDNSQNLVYDHDDEEPAVHARTWFALAAMFFLNVIQVFALLGPPAVLNSIEKDLGNVLAGNWVSTAIPFVQAVLAPICSSASDTFQIRKPLLIAGCLLGFVGAAIAPGSSDIYRLIGAQIMIGAGLATAPLAYTVPAEIVPSKWRPMILGVMNFGAGLAACSAPLILGALTRRNAHTGWRDFFWIQMAIWGSCAICIFVGYKPPTRHTRYDSLTGTQRIARLDLPGFALFLAGLTLFLVGLNLGGGLYTWSSATVLSTLIIGIALLVGFGIWEWKGTKTGMLNHEMFRGGKNRGRTFAILQGLIAIEGGTLFAYLVFYPVLTTNLFEMEPFLVTARETPFWLASTIFTGIYGFTSTKMKSIKIPLAVGFLLLTGGMVGLATIQPSDSTRAIVFSGLAGAGFGAPLVLCVAGTQLSTPHALIATATAVTVTTRSLAATVFTAIFAAALTDRITKDLPAYVAEAALKAGLPMSSLKLFVGAIATGDTTAVPTIPGVTPAIIGAALVALKQAFADSVRVVFIIASPFALLGVIGCYFIGDLKKIMTYHVDAPVEELHAKHHVKGEV